MTENKTAKKVYVSIGSNINKTRNLVSCITMMRNTFGELQLSSVYESDAVGFEGESFYNMVVSFETDQSPFSIADKLREIENRHHRKRNKNCLESRTLDLDQILHGNLAIDELGVQVPHDDIVKYAFVLCPLADIASHDRHPVLSKTYTQLWSSFDQSKTPLKKIPVNLNQTIKGS